MPESGFDDYELACNIALGRMQEIGAGVVVRLPAAYALAVIANIQLAMRHPGNTGPSRAKAEEAVRWMIDALCEHEPVLRTMLEMGFDPSQDVTHSDGPA